tara:strand:- start:80 stop:307 length:228 start_codon:yes stop_codon:yes gene_type:complete
MQKSYFHNDKYIDENVSKKKTVPFQRISQTRNVDINRLLNRLRIEKKSDVKRKVIFFISVILIIGFSLILIEILK